jgi:hypothetical protein
MLTGMRRLHGAVAFLAVLVLPLATFADAITPDYRPRQCPRGSWGGYPHGSGPCTAQPCVDDSQCFGNMCVSTALCVDGNEVVSECGAADACARGQCSRAPRCAPRAQPSPLGTQPSPLGAQRGCGCSAPREGRLQCGLGLLVVVALLAAMRRRWGAGDGARK